MKRYFENFLLMVQFLTRIPINKSLPCEKEDFRRGSMFLPVIGLIIGTIQWILYFILSNVLPSSIISVILVLASILITGALHLDGLGDTCDGFYAFKGKDRIIEIMKDSRIGTYACIAIVFDILIKIAAYSFLIDRNLHLFIIAVPVISRFCLDFLAFIGDNAKRTGTGNLFISNVGKQEIIIAIILTLLVSIPLLGPMIASLSLVVSLIITILFNKYCISKIDGLTGDTLGANNELVEILLLLLLCIISFSL